MRLVVVTILLALGAGGCATLGGGHAAPEGRTQVGLASVYAQKFQGRRTASGERYDGDAMTAAHRTLPFGSRVRVTHLGNGHSVVVRINDRGPFIRGRIIDVSRRAGRELSLLVEGSARVRVEILR